jgi:hypothetical protein
MESISASHIYKTLKDTPGSTGDIAWLAEVPMILLTRAARACIYAIYLTQSGNPGRAQSYMVLANGLATDEERPYVLHLQSVTAYLSGNMEDALTTALEAKQSVQDPADRELRADVLAHLAEIYKAAGNTQAGGQYEREADSVRRTPGTPHNEKA